MQGKIPTHSISHTMKSFCNITKTVSFWTSIQGGQTIRVERFTVLDLDGIAPGTARFKANFTSLSVHDSVTNGRQSSLKTLKRFYRHYIILCIHEYSFFSKNQFDWSYFPKINVYHSAKQGIKCHSSKVVGIAST